MFLLAYYKAFKQRWPLFGSANLLLAALAMLGVNLRLMQKGKNFSL